MKLALDHHYSPLIAEGLRQGRHDVIAAAAGAGWETEDDEALLVQCTEEQRALLTNDVADFVVITRRWLSEGRSHHGLIFTSDASRPRARDHIGVYVSALDALMQHHPEVDAFVDRSHWLG